MNHWLECYQNSMSEILGPTIEWFGWVEGGGAFFSLKTLLYSYLICPALQGQFYCQGPTQIPANKCETIQPVWAWNQKPRISMAL